MLIKWSMLISPEISHIDSMHPLKWYSGKALHFYGVLPPNPLPEFGHWKTSDKHNLKDSLQAP